MNKSITVKALSCGVFLLKKKKSLDFTDKSGKFSVIDFVCVYDYKTFFGLPENFVKLNYRYCFTFDYIVNDVSRLTDGSWSASPERIILAPVLTAFKNDDIRFTSIILTSSRIITSYGSGFSSLCVKIL